MVETGRWNRRGRGRLPVEERLCPCGEVQTELHVVQFCPQTQHIRDQLGFHTWQQLNESHDSPLVFETIHKILMTFTP